MEEVAVEGVSYVKSIRTQLKNLLLLLVGAIIFSFLMSILATLLVNYVMGEPFTCTSSILMGIVISILIVITYILYYSYVFKPNSRITKEIRIPIIYNRKDGMVIEDPFDGYYPQEIARQAFERFKETCLEIAERINEGIPPRTTKKHILTELLEYLIVLDLSKNLHGFGEKGLMPDTPAEIPDQLKKNSFISFFRSLKPKNIIDGSLSQLEFKLPRDIKIQYWSPAPIKDLIPDHNTFKIGFVGKYCEVYLTGQCFLGMIQSMQCGPAPIFRGIYIRRYYQDKLDLVNLGEITAHISVEAKFKLRAFLYPPSAYIEWIERWIEEFVKGRIFSGFDFGEFRKEKLTSMQYDLYETIKMIDVRTELIERDISSRLNTIDNKLNEILKMLKKR